MKHEEALKEQISLMLQKAERSIAAAEELFRGGYFDFVSSRAYYGAFYAVEAILLSENKTTSTHSGAISEFSKLFIKTNIFSKETGKSLSRLFENRQIGDYDFGMDITESEARTDIDAAANVVESIKKYLQENLS